MSEITISDYQKQVDAWINSVGVRYFDELTNLAQLMEEVGEVARIMSRTFGEQSSKPSDEPHDLADELAVIVVGLQLDRVKDGADIRTRRVRICIH